MNYRNFLHLCLSNFLLIASNNKELPIGLSEEEEERIGEMSKKVEKEKNARIEGERKFDQVRSC